jgi:hypothetical protein
LTDNTPFFIVGAGRSGTTLLRAIIANHSALAIQWETWFALDLVRAFPLREVLTREQVRDVVKTMTQDQHRWQSMGIAAGDLEAEALALDEPRLVDVISIVYRRHLASSGKRRFGDKTPPYIEIVRELATLYPGAKFIHLIRDGRDVATSYIELKWFGNCRCYERDFMWTRALRFRNSYRTLPIDTQILDVRYEDLVSEPEAVVRRICAFLGEEFEPAMLDAAARADSVPTAERSIHTKLGEPLSASASSRWRTKLSPFECFIMEACLQKPLREWGYELRFASIAWRPVLVTSGFLLRLMGPFLAKAIPALQRRKYLPERIYI